MDGGVGDDEVQKDNVEGGDVEENENDDRAMMSRIMRMRMRTRVKMEKVSRGGQVAGR